MYYSIWETGWGFMGAAGDERGLAVLTLPLPGRSEVEEELWALTPEAPLIEKQSFFRRLREELDLYLEGKLQYFSPFPLQWQRGTPFRRLVWRETRLIPYGKVITYRDLACRIGNPRGSRAVGQALVANPWPLLVPCHRVIASDGTLGGFGGGIQLKKKLLQLEGVEKLFTKG
ncbi:MAG: methylated-DNA--[protein]-cysteine S-methyltransferase [Bacillota bacterium]